MQIITLYTIPINTTQFIGFRVRSQNTGNGCQYVCVSSYNKTN